MAEPYIGQVSLFAGTFAPRNYAFCNGALLPIQQYTALFSLLGTTYGGDGRTTFALPDLRGRVPIGAGQGPGLSTRSLGQSGGVETVTLLQGQMPPHTHQLLATTSAGSLPGPTNAMLATPAQVGGSNALYVAGGAPVAMLQTIGIAGGSQPHNNLMPYLVINYIIALVGVFPSFD